jgi:hypothetical protein
MQLNLSSPGASTRKLIVGEMANHYDEIANQIENKAVR